MCYYLKSLRTLMICLILLWNCIGMDENAKHFFFKVFDRNVMNSWKLFTVTSELLLHPLSLIYIYLCKNRYWEYAQTKSNLFLFSVLGTKHYVQHPSVRRHSRQKFAEWKLHIRILEFHIKKYQGWIT